MNILIADDERLALEGLRSVVEAVAPGARIDCATTWMDALSAAQATRYDVAMLDIAMPERNGLELAKALKEIFAGTNIVFVTGYSDYAVDAFSMNASGYILKPAREADVRNALDHLRTPIQYRQDRLRVQCFGNFEVFSGGKPIPFRRGLSKEVLAYLVNLRGASATTNELCAVLFESDSISNKHYLRNLISDLRSTLARYGAEDVFLSRRNSFSIDPDRIDCDYYRYLQYDPAAVNSYAGEYMRQYSWAEMTNAFLSSQRPPRR